jgi:hypothetical protein
MTDKIQAGRYGSLRESHEPKLIAHTFMVEGVTPIAGYHAFDTTHNIGENAWGMDNNGPDPTNPSGFPNGLGDCGFAALDHYNVAKTGDITLIGKFGASKFSNLADAYFAYGIAQGEPGPYPDQGVSNATVLAWAVQQGLIYGYAEVQPQYLDWFAKEFGGALLGLAIDGNEASQDFNDSPRHSWNTMAQVDGHDTLFVKSTGAGKGTLVTWGGLQPFTKSFRENNVTDSWVIFNQYDSRVNWPALEAALTEVNGTYVTPTS